MMKHCMVLVLFVVSLHASFSNYRPTVKYRQTNWQQKDIDALRERLEGQPQFASNPEGSKRRKLDTQKQESVSLPAQQEQRK